MESATAKAAEIKEREVTGQPMQDSKPKSVSEEELQSVREINQAYQKLVFEVGELNISKIEIDRELGNKSRDLDSIRERERELGKDLESKYGIGRLNLENGEYQNM